MSGNGGIWGGPGFDGNGFGEETWDMGASLALPTGAANGYTYRIISSTLVTEFTIGLDTFRVGDVAVIVQTAPNTLVPRNLTDGGLGGTGGSGWLRGSGVPLNTLGTDGMYYEDTVTGGVYYKAAGVWAITRLGGMRRVILSAAPTGPLEDNVLYFLNYAAGAFDVSLPAAPATDLLIICQLIGGDVEAMAPVARPKILRNGLNIASIADDVVVDENYTRFVIGYSALPSYGYIFNRG